MTTKAAILKRNNRSSLKSSRSAAAKSVGKTASAPPIGVRKVVHDRAMRAFTRLLQFEESILSEAAQASSDYAVLSYLLGRPEVLALPAQDDPLANARMRGIEQKRRLLECEGGAQSASAIAELLGVTTQAINKRRSEGKLIAVELGTKGFHYPVWQFGVEGLESVLKVMRERDGWEKVNFFLNPNDALGGKRPIDVLRQKQIPLEKVLDAAVAFGDAGA